PAPTGTLPAPTETPPASTGTLPAPTGTPPASTETPPAPTRAPPAPTRAPPGERPAQSSSVPLGVSARRRNGPREPPLTLTLSPPDVPQEQSPNRRRGEGIYASYLSRAACNSHFTNPLSPPPTPRHRRGEGIRVVRPAHFP